MTKAVKPVAGEARHYIRIKEQILAEIAEGKLQPGTGYPPKANWWQHSVSAA